MSRKLVPSSSILVAALMFAGCAEKSADQPAGSTASQVSQQNTNDQQPSNTATSHAAQDSASTLDSASTTVRTGTEETPAGAHVASGAVSDFEPFEKLWFVDTDEYDYTTSFALSPKTRTFAVGSSQVKLWKLGASEPFDNSMENEKLADVVGFAETKTLAFSSDGSRLALSLDDGIVHIWNVADRTFELQIESHPDGVTDVAFSPDGKLLASAGYDNQVRVWDSSTGEPISAFDVDDRSQAAVAFSPDGKLLAACRQKATVWTIEDGKVRHEFANEFEVPLADVAFSPDETTLAIGEMAAQVQLWDLTSGQRGVACTGAEGPVDRVVWTPDGQRIIGMCGDYTVRIWDASGGAELQKIDFADDENTVTLVEIAWLPDSGHLVIVTEPGEVSVWGPKDSEFTTLSSLPLVEDSSAVGTEWEAEQVEVSTQPAPDESSTALVEANPDRIPGHVFEAVALLDLRTMLYPPGTDGANNEATTLHYHDIGTPAECLKFYDEWFPENGWTDITAQTNRGDGRVFEQNGFRVYANASAAPLGVMLTVQHQGNFDTRWLPMPSDVEHIGATDFAHSSVVSAQKKDELEEFLVSEFRQKDWHLSDRLAHGGDVSLDFIRNGIQAHVRLTEGFRYPGKTMLQYGVSLLRGEVPIPDDASDLKLVDYNGVEFSLHTALDVASAVEFYDNGMQARQWQPQHDPAEASDASTTLRYTRGREVAEVSIHADENAGTHVAGRTESPETDEYIAAAERANERSRVRDAQRKSDAMEALKHAMPVADFPLPDSATEVFRSPHGNASGGDIRFETTDDIPMNLKFFRDKLTALDWTEDPQETHDRDGFGQLVFRREKAEIKIHVGRNSDDKGGYYGMVEGSGLESENDLRHRESAESSDTASSAGPDLEALDQMVQVLSVIPGLENVEKPLKYTDWLKENNLKSSPENAGKYVEVFQAFMEKLSESAIAP